ncbi:DUF1569 domain-containing protein [bacterium]|nr:MAG: DUF1569 domain-containing protein [bacterium]
MKDIFDKQIVQELESRISKLTAETKPQWGKMSAPKMLAHVNVAYEMTYESIHPRPNPIMRFILKTFLKNSVCGPKPYPKNSPTAPQFIIKDEKNFDTEKKRLFDYLNRTVGLGRAHFEGKENLSFGKMTADEWNGLFYKHLDHHLTQFGV